MMALNIATNTNTYIKLNELYCNNKIIKHLLCTQQCIAKIVTTKITDK